MMALSLIRMPWKFSYFLEPPEDGDGVLDARLAV